MTLLPDDTGITALQWVAVGEGTRHECLDDDNDGTSYVKCTAAGREMIIEFANPSVAEASIESITNVQFLSSGRGVHRTEPALVAIEFEAPVGVSAYSETVSYNAHRASYETINGTARETYDGIHDWTYANLEDLELKCTKITDTSPAAAVEVYLSYLALRVTYVEAVSADNATFFGANF